MLRTLMEQVLVPKWPLASLKAPRGALRLQGLLPGLPRLQAKPVLSNTDTTGPPLHSLRVLPAFPAFSPQTGLAGFALVLLRSNGLYFVRIRKSGQKCINRLSLCTLLFYCPQGAG